MPGARLVAVTDVAPGGAMAFAGARGCAAEPSLDALLARADVDVVCVCVPSGLHAEVGARAARAGKHLVVEKPVDVTLEAADRLIDAARAAGVALTVMSQHRFDPGVTELKRLIDDGALGRLVLGEASTKWYRTQAYYDGAPWRGTWAMDGGALLNQGIHYVDLLRWCMGRSPRSPRSARRRRTRSRSRTPRSPWSGSPRARSARSCRALPPSPASRRAGACNPDSDGGDCAPAEHDACSPACTDGTGWRAWTRNPRRPGSPRR